MKEELEKEIKRCEELLVMYEEIPTGFFGASMIKMSLSTAKLALENGDEKRIKASIKDLKEIEG